MPALAIRMKKTCCTVLHPSLSTKTFLIKLLKTFEEQIEGFLNVTGDSSVKKLGTQA